MLCVTPTRAADAALIAAAQKEGQVTWYTTQITNQFGRPAMDAFQKRYGIRVNFIRADSIELAVRMTNEAQAGRLQADVFDGTSTAPAIKRAGLALKWLPDRARQWPAEYRDAEEYWVATNVYVHTPAYNTSLVPKGSEPRNFKDLLDPKWKGKMAWATHATSSGALGFIGTVLAAMGEAPGKAYLLKLAGQDIIQLGGSARTVVDQSIAGEYPVVLQIFNHQPVISAARCTDRLDPDEPGHGGPMRCRRDQGRAASERRQAPGRLPGLGRGTEDIPRGRLYSGRPRCSAARASAASRREELPRHFLLARRDGCLDAALARCLS
jgi:ABC-type thiamine transport system substrate-binding protein